MAQQPFIKTRQIFKLIDHLNIQLQLSFNAPNGT